MAIPGSGKWVRVECLIGHNYLSSSRGVIGQARSNIQDALLRETRLLTYVSISNSTTSTHLYTVLVVAHSIFKYLHPWDSSENT